LGTNLTNSYMGLRDIKKQPQILHNMSISIKSKTQLKNLYFGD